MYTPRSSAISLQTSNIFNKNVSRRSIWTVLFNTAFVNEFDSKLFVPVWLRPASLALSIIYFYLDIAWILHYFLRIKWWQNWFYEVFMWKHRSAIMRLWLVSGGAQYSGEELIWASGGQRSLTCSCASVCACTCTCTCTCARASGGRGCGAT